MPVRFFYVDESYNSEYFCLSAISIRHSHWKECFDLVCDYRSGIKQEHGIFIRKEIHARDFVRGKGHISNKIVGKFERTQIFRGLLELVARLPTVQLFNVCLCNKGLADAQMTAWDRLVNRIERTMRKYDEVELNTRAQVLADLKTSLPETASGSISYLEERLNVYRARAFLIADEGREKEITRAIRKMRVVNYVPSKFGAWRPGVPAKNITAKRIIEDPVFKPSDRSYFLQLADCVAYALLKQESKPTPFVAKYRLHEAFDDLLKDVCFKRASPRDRQGVVRA